MNVQVSWHNIPSSPYMQPILEREISRLERRFPVAEQMGVRFRQEGERYRARVHVQALGRDWWVTGEGANLTEGLMAAFEHLERKIGEFKRYTKDKINKRFRRLQG
ncbi:MAG: HPF/RaiA family ribosome-associated protein [Bacteriovoracaceae bacterium]|nr:HPF/RaiA family ribosome-associated protein [Bacteriovoracaceae bacterium]